VSLERNACRTNGCSRTLAGFKAINVPEQRFLEITGQRFVLNDAATDLASPLGRIFDTQRLFLRRHAPGRNYQKKRSRNQTSRTAYFHLLSRLRR